MVTGNSAVPGLTGPASPDGGAIRVSRTRNVSGPAFIFPRPRRADAELIFAHALSELPLRLPPAALAFDDQSLPSHLPGSRLVRTSFSRSATLAVNDHGLGCLSTCRRPRLSSTS